MEFLKTLRLERDGDHVRLITPEARHVHGRPQLPGLCLLLARNRERLLETSFGFCRIRLWRHQGDFTGDAINLGLVPSFLCHFDRRYCFANVAQGIIELAKLPRGPCQ